MPVRRIPELGWVDFPYSTTPGLPLREGCWSLGEAEVAEDPGQEEGPRRHALIGSALPLPGCVTYSRLSLSLSLALRLPHILSWVGHISTYSSSGALSCPLQPTCSVTISLVPALWGKNIVCIIYACVCIIITFIDTYCIDIDVWPII